MMKEDTNSTEKKKDVRRNPNFQISSTPGPGNALITHIYVLLKFSFILSIFSL